LPDEIGLSVCAASRCRQAKYAVQSLRTGDIRPSALIDQAEW
jgi:hypothetical protein